MHDEKADRFSCSSNIVFHYVISIKFPFVNLAIAGIRQTRQRRSTMIIVFVWDVNKRALQEVSNFQWKQKQTQSKTMTTHDLDTPRSESKFADETEITMYSTEIFLLDYAD